MLAQLARLERRYLEIESLLARPETIADAGEFRRLSKERADIEEGVELYRSLKRCQSEKTALVELLQEPGEMAQMAADEMQQLSAREEELRQQLRLYLIPKDPRDSRNVILEIRAGAGGDEASLFAADLFRMYNRFCDRRKWRFEILSLHENGLGGFKEAIALVTGESAYRTLKYESGVHRVQRVPVTESQGRVHTSTVTVAVLPEADEVEVTIQESDLKIDTFRAGGAGGQHVNRTDSAVRLTHLPSGIVISCQDERSQLKNRAKALKILKSRLLEAAEADHAALVADDRRSQVGRGDRSERIRTYNFPQSRVTDHRVNWTTHSIDEFLDGGIVEVLRLLEEKAQAEALARQAEGGDA